jgi:hypothetical protein
MEFTGLLAVLFIGLKLAEIINWSWWWVLSPIWVVPVLVILLAFAGGMVKESKRNRRMR